MRTRRLHAALLALMLTLWLAGVAEAHAFLSQATPAPDSASGAAPTVVRLRFTEEVEAQFDALLVYNVFGVRVDPGDAAVDPHDPTQVVASLKPLPAGAYTVVWHVISDDGHPVSGMYGFQVGPASPNPVYYQPGQAAPAGRPPLSVLLGYWLGVGGLMALAGLGITQAAVIRAVPGQRYRWTVAASLVAAFGGAVVLVLGRTAQAAGTSLYDVAARSLWLQMLGTQAGKMLVWRLGVVAVGTLVLHFFWPRWWLSALFGAAGLLTVAMGGHAIALADPVTGVLLDWIHLLAAALWVGGLLQFALVLRPGAEAAVLVRRFSPLAGASVLLLALTGLYPALARIPGLAYLTGSSYGWALVVKLALLAPLLLLGGLNLVVVGPRLRRGEPVGNWLRWLTAAEAILFALVLAAAAVLTNSPPPRG